MLFQFIMRFHKNMALLDSFESLEKKIVQIMTKEYVAKMPNFPLFMSPDIATYRNFIMWQISLPLLLHHMISGENGFSYRISFLLMEVIFCNFGSKLFLILVTINDIVFMFFWQTTATYWLFRSNAKPALTIVKKSRNGCLLIKSKFLKLKLYE